MGALFGEKFANHHKVSDVLMFGVMEQCSGLFEMWGRVIFGGQVRLKKGESAY